MSDALISLCGRYRYWLSRPAAPCLFPSHPTRSTALFIMLNPSTADASKDDQTIIRCRGFAKTWECNGLIVANLYALRSTDPKKLLVADDPVGPDNDDWLEKLIIEHVDVVCAWGVNADQYRVGNFCRMAAFQGARLWCLGTTKSGAPRHPLRIRSDQPLIRWEQPT